MTLAAEASVVRLLTAALCGSVLLVLLATFAVAKPGPDRRSMEDCLVQIDGKTVIDGRCRVSTTMEAIETYETRQLTGLDGDGHLTYFVEIKVYAPGKGIAVWNGASGQKDGHAQIGPVELDDRCWLSRQVRLCNWDAGQPRSRTALPDYPKAAPVLALPDFDFDAGCKYFGSHHPDTAVAEAQCLKVERDSRDDLQSSWPDVPYSAKAQCLLGVMRFARMFGYGDRKNFPFEALRTCISRYIDRVGIGQQEPPRP